jgi:hypothetical protein
MARSGALTPIRRSLNRWLYGSISRLILLDVQAAAVTC